MIHRKRSIVEAYMIRDTLI